MREDDGSPTSAGPLPHSGNSISNTHCLSPSVGAVSFGSGVGRGRGAGPGEGCWARGGVLAVDGPSWL